MDKLLNLQLGPYRVVRQLGEGGMGSVYEAVNDSVERRVAIKFLRSDSADDPEVVSRFLNEARATNRIDHPSIVQIHESGRLPDGTPYLVMELLRGETLQSRMQRGQLGTRATLQIAWQIADALAAAHKRGIVHRDLKPSNLMLSPDPLVQGGERVKVLDFGIAKLIVEGHRGAKRSQLVMVTPVYMSPEQCRGAGAVSAKTDVYALGIILYEMLAGQPPFTAAGVGELIGSHLFCPPPNLAERIPSLPAEVASFVMSLLAKDPESRPSMQEVANHLNGLTRYLESAPTVKTESLHGLVGKTVLLPASGTGNGNPGRSSGNKTGLRTVGALLVGIPCVLGAIWGLRPSFFSRPQPTVTHPVGSPSSSNALVPLSGSPDAATTNLAENSIPANLHNRDNDPEPVERLAGVKSHGSAATEGKQLPTKPIISVKDTEPAHGRAEITVPILAKASNTEVKQPLMKPSTGLKGTEPSPGLEASAAPSLAKSAVPDDKMRSNQKMANSAMKSASGLQPAALARTSPQISQSQATSHSPKATPEISSLPIAAPEPAAASTVSNAQIVETPEAVFMLYESGKKLDAIANAWRIEKKGHPEIWQRLGSQACDQSDGEMATLVYQAASELIRKKIRQSCEARGLRFINNAFRSLRP